MNEIFEKLISELDLKQKEALDQASRTQDKELYALYQGKVEAFATARQVTREEQLRTLVKDNGFNDIYLVKYEETNRICYCGHDAFEANKWLEMSHYTKEEADKYQLTIYDREGRFLNEGIRKKIKNLA